MPPKRLRLPMSNPPAPAEATTPSASPAPVTARCLVDRLRLREDFLDADELAKLFKYKNVKRVYELPIRRAPLGGKGKRALRWDPVDVADYLDGRWQSPGDATAA